MRTKANKYRKQVKHTHTLASSRPNSLTGVPDLGETKEPSDNSSIPIIRPGHHDPFRRRTQTKPPTDASMTLDLASPEVLPISETKHQQQQNQNKKKTEPKKRKKLLSQNSILAVHPQVQENSSSPNPRFHENPVLLIPKKPKNKQNPDKINIRKHVILHATQNPESQTQNKLEKKKSTQHIKIEKLTEK